MGGLVGGIFDLAEGDPTQSEQQGLGSLAGYENNTGEGAVNQGLGFYNDILSGDPSKIAQVEAPEIKAGQDQVQQSAEQSALFGNRGGGGNSSANAAQAGQRGNIIELTGQLQSGAAGAELGAGQNLLGQGASNLNSEAGLAAANQQRETGDVSGIAQSAAEIAAPFLGGGAAAQPLSPGTVSDPGISNYQSNNGPEPSLGFNPGELDTTSGPDMSVFE